MARKRNERGNSARRPSGDGSFETAISSGSRVKPSREGGKSKPGFAAELGRLYLVATPIGNAGDISARALETLAGADVIACEDTRVTAKLLAIHGIDTPRTAYHEHNAARAGPRILARLARGDNVALVSDAGTPLVSDPGYRLVQAAIAAAIPITAIPGPFAGLAALILSGLPTDRFFFQGFLPARHGQRVKTLNQLTEVPATLIFQESARRLAASLADMARVLGPRDAAVARELTKLFEEVRRGDLAVLAREYAADGPPRGEVVIVVAPPGAAAGPSEDELDRRLIRALAVMSTRDAAAFIAAETGLPRRRVYARALELDRAAKEDAGNGG